MSGAGPDFEHRLYVGEVMHMRLRPFRHRFRYRVFTLLLDVDRLAAAESRLLKIDRFGLFAFHRRDHAGRDGGDLRAWAEARLAEAGRPRPARLMLLSMPRLFGYAFNPLSVWFAYDAAGRLESAIYEVKNTFGDQIPYVHAVEPEADGAARHERAKAMFVSPFLGWDQTYRFTLRAPGARLALRIRQGDATGDDLIATQTGARRALSDAALLRLSLTHPLAAFKVIAAIHWQALRLWLKGARFHRYPGGAAAFRPAAGPGSGQGEA